MNTAERLADFVVKSRLEDMPLSVVERTKELLLDAVGAGSQIPIMGILGSHYQGKATFMWSFFWVMVNLVLGSKTTTSASLLRK